MDFAKFYVSLSP